MNLNSYTTAPVDKTAPIPVWRHFKALLRIALLSVVAASLHATASASQEPAASVDIIKGFYAGWEQKDWNRVAGNLAEGFTFTTPAPDDHIPLETFRAKCWNQAAHIRKLEIVKFSGDEHAAFVIVHIITMDNRVLRNTDYFTFRDGKIQSIEVFFGDNGLGYPTNKQ